MSNETKLYPYCQEGVAIVCVKVLAFQCFRRIVDQDVPRATAEIVQRLISATIEGSSV